MDALFLRNLKLAIAVCLVCFWGFATVSGVNGVSSLLCIAAMVQWPTRVFTQPMVWRSRGVIVGVLFLVALFGLCWALSEIVAEDTFKSFWTNPLVVIVVGVLSIFGLVRQASIVARAGA